MIFGEVSAGADAVYTGHYARLRASPEGKGPT